MLIANGVDITAGTDHLLTERLHVPSIRVLHRRKRPRKIILDWSGNEESAEEYGAFLGRSEYGTHLYIDHQGVIWQFADLWAGKVRRGRKAIDEEAVWIVLQNKGKPPEDARVRRGTFIYQFGAHKIPALCMLTEQVDSLLAVLELICQSLQIPPCIPRKNEEPIITRISETALASWNGILLASHIDSRTIAPGPGILDELDAFEQEMLEPDDDTDFEGEDQNVDPEAFEEAFPDA